jgi:hypothetical protein
VNLSLLALLLLGILTPICRAQSPSPLSVTDADGKVWTLNAPGRVTVIIGNSPASAQAARDCGKALDEFQGRPDFRALVVVDLRGSLAHFAQGYTRYRMRHDLNAEAVRITPWYRRNHNLSDPRRDIGAVADFDGSVCDPLGWPRDVPGLRVVIFDKTGNVTARFEPANDLRAVRDAVFRLLNGKSSPSIPGP